MHNSQEKSPGSSGQYNEAGDGKTNKNSFQTQQKTRPFRTHSKNSVLAPYINFLRGCSSNVVLAQQSQLGPHEVRRPSLFLFVYG